MVKFSVLGPTEVTHNGQLVPVQPPKQRALLAYLLLHANEVLSVDRILDALWSGEPPEGGAKTLQVHVAGLRKALEPDRPPGRPSELLLTQPPGYMLQVDTADFDVARFEQLLEAAVPQLDSDPERAAHQLREGLSMWRGRPYEDVAYEAFAQADIRRLEEMRLLAIEHLFEAELRLGHHRSIVSDLERTVEQHPVRERLWAQLMLALYRSARQADALAAYRAARRVLVEEFGLDPSVELQKLEQRILDQDPTLLHRNGVASVPARLRGYEIRGVIATRGSTSTYRAFQPSVSREVAIEAIPPETANRADFIRRFDAEARLIASLEHPNFAPLFDFWRDPDGAHLVTPLYRGGALLGAAQGAGWETVSAVRIVDQIVSAWRYARRHGVMLGDPNPHRIGMDEEGNAYLHGALSECCVEVGEVAAPVDGPFTAPERRLGDAASPRSDVYGLASLAFLALTGSAPPLEAAAEAARRHEGVDAAVMQVIATGLERAPADRYPRPRDLLAALHSAAGTTRARSLALRNPYKGLRAFSERDAGDFFGRDDLIDELLVAVDRHRLVGVIGPSGSGKSSVVHAGLVPALRNGRLPRSERWLVATMTPGDQPFERLEDAILGLAVAVVPTMAARLRTTPDEAAAVVAEAMPGRAELLLIVDQFEELFTLNTADVQQAFMGALRTLATSTTHRHIKVLVAMRADFFDRPLATHTFGDLLRKGVVMVTALSAEGLRAAIVSPAKIVGVELESGLADDIVADVADQAGGMPLMEYALTRLFDQRDDGLLTAAVYHKFGGVLGALGRQAEDCFATLDDAERQAVRQIMLRLVAVGESGDDTRRRVPLSELTGLAVEQRTIDAVLTLYGDHRLLTFDRDPRTREPTVEVAHEALLSRWDRLRTWIDDRRDDLLDRRRLGEAVREWNEADRAGEYLLAGGRLGHFEAWAAETDLSLTADERALLAASRDRVDEVTNRQTRRRWLIVAGFAVVTLLAIGLALVASANQRSAEREAAVSRARELTAAAVDALDDDRQLSLLLGLEAADVGRASIGSILPETLDALHQAIGAARLQSAVALESLPEGRGIGMAVNTAGLIALTSTGDVVELRHADDPESIVATLGTARDAVQVGNDAQPAFDPAGSRLAVTASDGTVRVWDVAARTEVWSVATDAGGPRDATFGPDGGILVTTGDQSVTMWESATGEERWAVEIAEPSPPAFSPDGSRLAVGSWFGRDLSILDAATGEELVSRPVGFSVDGLLWTPDGSRILIGIEPGDIVVLDAETLEQLDVWSGHGATPAAMAVDAAAGLLASGGDDGTVLVWDLEGTGLMELTGHEGNIGGVAFVDGGSHLVTVGSDRILRRYDISAAGPGEVFAAATTGAQSYGIDLAPGGDLLIAHALEGEFTPAGVVMWDLETGEQVLRLDGLDWFPFGGVSFAPGGAAFVVQEWDEAGAEQMGDDAFEVLAGPQWGPIHLRDVPTGEPLLEFEASAGSDRQTLVFDAAGSLLAGGGSDDSGTGVLSTASVWDAATGRLLHRFDHDDFAVAAVALSADGSQLATATCEIGWVALWDLSSESVEWQVDYPGCSTRVAISAAGDFVVATSLDNPPTVWDLASGDPRYEITAHGGGGFAVDVSSDGSLIVSGGNDGSVVVVDAATAEVVTRIQVGETAIGAVAFSADDRHLAVATLDGLAFVYTLDADELVSIAASRLLRTLTEDECAAYRIEPCGAQR